jgi:hypothetical protein
MQQSAVLTALFRKKKGCLGGCLFLAGPEQRRQRRVGAQYAGERPAHVQGAGASTFTHRAGWLRGPVLYGSSGGPCRPPRSPLRRKEVALARPPTYSRRGRVRGCRCGRAPHRFPFLACMHASGTGLVSDSRCLHVAACSSRSSWLPWRTYHPLPSPPLPSPGGLN